MIPMNRLITIKVIVIRKRKKKRTKYDTISQSIALHFLDSGEISVIALQSLWICDAIDSQSHESHLTLN